MDLFYAKVVFFNNKIFSIIYNGEKTIFVKTYNETIRTCNK
jgi:hypothetical protein